MCILSWTPRENVDTSGYFKAVFFPRSFYKNWSHWSGIISWTSGLQRPHTREIPVAFPTAFNPRRSRGGKGTLLLFRASVDLGLGKTHFSPFLPVLTGTSVAIPPPRLTPDSHSQTFCSKFLFYNLFWPGKQLEGLLKLSSGTVSHVLGFTYHQLLWQH